ncbi:MAG: hypothetical protein LGB52_07125, partial [Sulfurovum sp.]|nr:hypothetical protein [Sulfurovum sp.]
MLRVIDEIQHVGLYSLILQDIQKITGKEKPSAKEVEEALRKHPSLLRDYMQTTVEYNLSNIHLKDINLDHIATDYHVKAKKINENLTILRKLEKYTLDFEQSSTLVLIFSVEFLVLFSVQYFIVLLNLKVWQWYIYGLFALSIVVAWIYAKKVRKKYENGNTEYERLYKETLKLIE